MLEKAIEFGREYPDKWGWSTGVYVNYNRKITSRVRAIMGLGGECHVYHDRPKGLYRVINKGQEIITITDNLNEENITLLRKHAYKLRHDAYKHVWSEWETMHNAKLDKDRQLEEDLDKDACNDMIKFAQKGRHSVSG